MASSAAETLTRSPGRWREVLESAPGRLEFTTRIALICSLTVLVTAIYQTPEPALTAYIAFFLNRADRTTSVVLNVGLCVVVTVIIGMLVILAMAVADDPMWRVICIAVLSFVFLFLGSASKLRPVGGTLALVVGFALDVLGMIQLGEEATRGLLYAWLFVGIPAGVSLVVNLVLAPAPRRLAEQAIARRLRVCARLLRGADDSARRAFQSYLAEGVAEIESHLRLSGLEKTVTAHDLAALRQAAASCWALLCAVEVLESSPDMDLPGPWRTQAAQTLDEMAVLLEHGQYPLEVALEQAPAGEALATQIAGEIREAIIAFAEPPPPSPVAAAHAHEGFFVQDAFTNRDHVRYALRTTAAALFCYALYTLLDWPGIHTCFITCYIVSQTTAAESIEKLTLRIVGCVIGSALGIAAILYVVPMLTTVGQLMIVVFVGTWLAGYIAAGSPRVSYAGFQIAFAFFLCVLQGNGPALDMVVARDRVLGILIGNVVAYLALTRVWPMSVSARVDPALTTILDRLSGLLGVSGSRERRLACSDIRTRLTAVQTDIDLAAYEPEALRPSPGWVAARRAAVQDARALAAAILVGTEQRALVSASVRARLQALMTRQRPAAAAQPTAPAAPKARSLQSLIDARLSHLEQLLDDPPGHP